MIPTHPAFKVAKHPTDAPIDPSVAHHFFNSAVPLGLIHKENCVMTGKQKDIQLLSELGFLIEDWISPHKLNQWSERLDKMLKHLLPKSAERVKKLTDFFQCCYEYQHGIKIIIAK